MWLALSLGRYKWSNLITPCCVGALHDVDLDEDIKDLSGGECDIPEN
jgi:hypothetical protein